ASARRQSAPGRAVSLEWPLEPVAAVAGTTDRPARPARQPRPGRATCQLARAARSTRRPARRLAPAPGGWPERRQHAPQRARLVRRRTGWLPLGPAVAGTVALAATTQLDCGAQQPWQPPGQRSAGQLAADPAGRGRCGPATAPLPAATGRPGRTDAAPGAPAGLAAPGSRRSGSP